MVVTDKPTIVTESMFNAIVMGDGQGDECLPDPAGTNESGGCDVFGQTNDLVDQLATCETDSRCRRRRLARSTRYKYEILDPMVVGAADLVSF